MRNRSAFALEVVTIFLLVSCDVFALPQYEIIDLGTLDGWSYAQAINDRGEVAGWYYASDNRHASFWDATHAMTDLGTFMGNHSQGFDLNKAGHVVGWGYSGQYYFDFNNAHALLWAHGVITDLGHLGGNYGCAYGINDAEQVVGYSYTSSGNSHAFLWEDGTMIDLGTLDGYSTSKAYGINNVGQIVGVLGVSNEFFFPCRAFLWEDGQMVDLGISSYYSSAKSINIAGQVVGEFGDLLNPHAFIWDRINGMIDLGTLGGSMSTARAINDAGQVVGDSYTENPDIGGNAFIWDKCYGMINLNDLLPANSGWRQLMHAMDINNQGYIVGYGVTDNNVIHAFLMIPEPAALSLLGLGGLIIRRLKVKD
jgi:probable HAF family extracellular repeat protein